MNRKLLNLFLSVIKNPSYAFHGLKNKIVSITNFDYHFLNGYSFFPGVIRVDLTYKCNLRCKICFEFGENSKGKIRDNSEDESISIELLKKIIDEASDFKPTFYLSGGEPLIYSKINELIEYLQDKKLYCLINTNGVLLKNCARDLVKFKVDKIVVSIDGPEKVHDLNRGRNFKQIIEGIEFLKNIKKSENSHFPLIRVNSLITPFNSEYLEDTVSLAEDLGVDSLTFQHPMFSNEEVRKEYVDGVEAHRGDQINILGFTYKGGIDTDSLIRQIRNIQKRKVKIPVGFYPSIKVDEIKFYYNDFNYKFKDRCLSAWRKVVITPKGDIGPCVNHILDNINNKSFREIWNSKRYKEFRKELKTKGLLLSCLRCCLREY